MKITPDDPRLTAYVIEELDEPERAAVDAAVAESEELRREALAIHQTAQWLVEELQAAPRPGLAPEQIAVVQAAFRAAEATGSDEGTLDAAPARPDAEPRPDNVIPLVTRWRRWAPWSVGLAACLVAIVAAWKYWLAPAPLDPQVTMLREPPTPAEPSPPAVIAVPAEPPTDEDPAPSAVPPVVAPSEPSTPSTVPAEPKPTGDIRMMMRYGLMPKGYRLAQEGADLPPADPYSAPQPQSPGAGSRSAPPGAPQDRPGAPSGPGRGLALDPVPRYLPAPEGEVDSEAHDDPFRDVQRHPLSTFSLDVDTASYSIVRRYLSQRQRPPRDIIRLEELINYFAYDYAPPTGEVPVAAHVEIAGCPWAPAHRLVRIGLKAREIAHADRPPCNLVFLIDVSGSMESAAKLPLLKQALRLLVEKLNERDTVGIVVYASDSRTVLWPTPGDQHQTILAAIEALQAGGSTHGSAGIRTAYDLAWSHFREGGANRVLLCTDGDFNVGITDRRQLASLIAEQARTGVFLTTLGFGTGNYKDTTLETLADRGNGNYAYVDTLKEAYRVLVEQLRSTLVTVAKDVKAQVEFNPAEVRSYRLLGYENRLLRARDFKDDRRDAGELGGGHTVTVLYEIVPASAPAEPDAGDPLKYQPAPTRAAEGVPQGETLTLKIRYKTPHAETSQQLEVAVRDGGRTYAQASTDFKFAAAVAAFGLILQDAPARGSTSWGAVLELAGEGLGRDEPGHRADFLELVRQAERARPAR